jgi:hypothetical protein
MPPRVAIAVARSLDEGMWIIAAGSAALSWLARLVGGFLAVVAVNGPWWLGPDRWGMRPAA